MKPFAIVRDAGKEYRLTLWWSDAGLVEGEFIVREVGEGE